MNQNILYYGSQQGPPQCHRIQIGQLSFEYERGFIRHVSLGGSEVLNMIYFALRDHQWRTYHGTIKNEVVKHNEKNFNISFRSVISESSIQYVFDCSIKGNAAGKIEFEIKGESYSNFRSNRIGFCVLHSVGNYAGKPVWVRSPDGSEREGIFPVLAEPHQPFINIRSIHWEPVKGWNAEMRFEGDIFEMEDQRNWSDFSYKTYCTPLEKPFPVEVKMGDKIKQRITLNVEPLRKAAEAKIKPKPELSVSIAKGSASAVLPTIGLGDSSVYEGLSEKDINLLRALQMDHLYGEIDLGATGRDKCIKKLKTASSGLGVRTMVSLLFGENSEKEAEEFIHAATSEGFAPGTATLFHKLAPVTPLELLNRVAESMRKAFPGIIIGAGSHNYFAELNRNRIGNGGYDFLSFPSSPQAHLVDNQILIDNLEGASGAHATAASFANGKPVYVGPVSLRSRQAFKTNANEPVSGIRLPDEVDEKQSSLLCASWTLGCVKHLAEAGTACVTFFETAGWKGVIQGSSPSPVPSLFFAHAGSVFPVYYIFYWLGRMAGAGVIPAESTDPGKVSGLALEKNGEKYLLLANHTAGSVEPVIKNLKKARIISRLNEKNAASFMNDPLIFFDKIKEEEIENSVPMMPFEIIVIRSGK